MQYRSLGIFALAAGLGTVALAKTAADSPQDQIEVVGHVAVGNRPVTRLLATEHYGRSYLYAEHAGGHTVTLIDVSKLAAPTVVADVSYPQNARDGLVAVAGTAALVEDRGGPSASAPRSIKLMDFSDKEHPRVAREFNGVTALTRDPQRGLVFLANQDGVWILREKLAEDPVMEKAYENYLLYNR